MPGPKDAKHYEIWYKHYNDGKFTIVNNKKDIAGEVQALVDSPGVEDVEVFEVTTTTKRLDHNVPEPTKGSQAHVAKYGPPDPSEDADA